MPKDRIRDPREEILLETNFEDDGVLTRAYNNNPYNSSSSQNRRRSIVRSEYSLDRYREPGGSEGDWCKSCLGRIPYATLIATVMLVLGVGIFCGTLYRGAAVSIIMVDTVFQVRTSGLKTLQIFFVIIAIGMVAIGLLILFVGFLSTGATRRKVYKKWRTRVGGRIACAVLMAITYFLEIVWAIIFSLLSIVSFVYAICWYLCKSIETSRACIDLVQFGFLIPGAQPENLKICTPYQIKAFCKDGVEVAVAMFTLATVATFLVILSLIHYLMCLSANYAHIRDQAKFQELQEIQNLNEHKDFSTSKDRF